MPSCTKNISKADSKNDSKILIKCENSDTDEESNEKPPIEINTIVKLENQSTQNSISTRRSRERYEVVYRTLLRRFRKFFNQQFDKKTRYKSLKRYRTNKYFIECVSQYVKDMFSERYSQKLVFSLAHLIYPNILIKNLDELKKTYSSLPRFLAKQKREGMQINDILYDFTFTKMKLLFTNKQYSYFFRYFVDQNQAEFKNDELYASQEMVNLWK